MSVSAMLKAFRLKAGLSQEDLAEALSVHQTYVSAVERGSRSPSWRYLVNFANVVGANIVTLLREVGLVSPDTVELEQEIAALIDEEPILEDLFAAAGVILRNDPRRLKGIVDFIKNDAERILAEMEEREHEKEGGGMGSLD